MTPSRESESFMRSAMLLFLFLSIWGVQAAAKKPFIYFRKEGQVASFDHRHKVWSQILTANVVQIRGPRATALKYSTISKKKLDRYINDSLDIKKSVFDKWNKNQQLAFYINLYNALTVQIILRNYPLKSIKEIGSLFTSTWKKKFFTLFGRKSYLDLIEHEYVRKSGKFNDPRIHFAFNCASGGCPALRNVAYTPENLDKQLEMAAVDFLSDNKRNYFDGRKKVMYISKIFDWYKGDFEKGWGGANSLKSFLNRYSQYLATSPWEQKLIKSGSFRIKYLPYDWNLNEAR